MLSEIVVHILKTVVHVLSETACVQVFKVSHYPKIVNRFLCV